MLTESYRDVNSTILYNCLRLKYQLLRLSPEHVEKHPILPAKSRNPVSIKWGTLPDHVITILIQCKKKYFYKTISIHMSLVKSVNSLSLSFSY